MVQWGSGMVQWGSGVVQWGSGVVQWGSGMVQQATVILVIGSESSKSSTFRVYFCFNLETIFIKMEVYARDVQTILQYQFFSDLANVLKEQNVCILQYGLQYGLVGWSSGVVEWSSGVVEWSSGVVEWSSGGSEVVQWAIVTLVIGSESSESSESSEVTLFGSIFVSIWKPFL